MILSHFLRNKSVYRVVLINEHILLIMRLRLYSPHSTDFSYPKNYNRVANNTYKYVSKNKIRVIVSSKKIQVDFFVGSK